MEQRIYGIYDLKAEALVGKVIQIMGTDAEAIRMFAGVLATSGTLLSEHPDDFNLHYLGSIDLVSLKLTPNLNSLHLPVASGFTIVREIQRARSNSNAQADSPEAVLRDQLSLAPA